MSAPVRLTAVLTHPIQYYSPWFRHLHANAPEVALTVLHATEPTAEQQGVGFERAFSWDVPLTEGFRSITVRPAQPGDRVDSNRFTGLDVKEIGAAIERTRPDVVLITGWYSVTLVRALLACRRLGVPALYRGDTNLLSQPLGWRRPLAALKTRWLLRRFAGFLSPGIRSTAFLRHHGAPDYRIFRAPHAVDNAMFAAAAAPFHEAVAREAARRRRGLDADAFVVLFAGKLAPSKRPVQLVRAIARLGAGATLLVAGSGPLEAEMRAEADRLGVSIAMAGFMNQRELGEAYGIADCLALPSDSAETWGLVVNEALSAGLPCVVSDAVGCAPDLIRDGEAGYVVPLDDVEAMAAALAKVRQRTNDGFDWRSACRAIAAEYDFDALTAGVVRACRSVIAHSPGPEPDWSASPVRVVACCGGMVSAGGLERMTFEVLDVLRQKGAAAHAIVNAWENFRITALADAAGASWSIGPYWYTLRRRKLTLRAMWQMGVEVSRVSLDLLRVSRRVRPTHVLLPDFYAALRNFPALLWLRLRGVSVIARLGTAPPPGRFYRHLWRWGVDPVVDRYVANSPFTRRELMAHGIDGDKIETIENMAPRRAWSAAEGERIPGRVIFVGQIIPGKGLDLLLDAMAQLRSRGVDATLDVVGAIDGWEAPEYLGHRAALRDRAARPDLAGVVNFLGVSENVPALLGRASVHCCPSLPELREGFGLVVLEAKLAGLPSVVTPSGNLPDMIDHGRDGWLCPRTDAAAISEGLEMFLTRPELLAAAGRAARQSAERYNDRRFASAWARVFAGGPHEYAMKFNDIELGAVVLVSFVSGYVCDDWLGTASIVALWICVKLVWTEDRLFVMPLALTFQWAQVALGVLYKGFTGREVQAHYLSDYRPMVWIGLGCCLALAGGIKLGYMLRKPPDPNEHRPEIAFGFPPLMIAYVVSIFVEGSILAVAPDYTSFRQLITTLDTARLGILFLVFRRFCAPPSRWGLLLGVLAFEIVLGITGFFAGFREPIILAVLATLEVFDRRNSRHWLFLIGGAVAAVGLGLVWMGIRGVYRTEYVEMDKFANSRSARVERVRDLTSDFLNAGELLNTTDSLVDRMWTVYYPALAIARVPSILPHTNGEIFGAALVHIVTPRIFFPNKGELMSDSDMVRKYSNIQVAGREHGTSIAFGYAAESYIDFGVPLMFAPVFAFGIFIGFMYGLFRQLIWHRELFVSFATVAFWLSVYLFERSWANTLGIAVGFMVYLGAPVVLLDRFLMVKVAKDSGAGGQPLMFDPHLQRDRL